MKSSTIRMCGLPLVIAVVTILTPRIVVAQTVEAPQSAASASAYPPIKMPPRLLSPDEKRDSATQPGDIRPERPIAPQITVPFGKAPPAAPKPTRAQTRSLPRSSPASASGIDDSAARCESEESYSARLSCRAKLKGDSKARAPV